MVLSEENNNKCKKATGAPHNRTRGVAPDLPIDEPTRAQDAGGNFKHDTSGSADVFLSVQAVATVNLSRHLDALLCRQASADREAVLRIRKLLAEELRAQQPEMLEPVPVNESQTTTSFEQYLEQEAQRMRAKRLAKTSAAEPSFEDLARRNVSGGDDCA